ncbi:histidinol-phosphatase [Cellvibrio japonicus]|uniref:HAD-superfamily subfamily IB hydrolase, TIGR01490 n=1 Tax=Cellvibrio japonicus (strain Ueda107) TaxID=498211 RepID=B3PIV3_CELJU|nr:HAD family hydrolase [Cellvibrio japonicus]ACE83482.1 HAD-superfamily subfamily IB hydrolase, TIGR01490 [Cellvibrio japonicus Ueda107]QEI11163.1 HAD family hydrolase [Cellvibrio japonicus]QEI14737.1 HAD family hydrolase [Cellvibrio japonicus]QEI18317.1 HAD family hydrolase [Cellvibrio japonicus]
MNLAIFDLDNTLIAGDSDHSWGQFLVERGLVDAELYKRANDQFYQDYKNATLDIDAYLKFSLKPLTEHSLEQLAQLHSEFMATHIAPMLLPKAQALLGEHRAKGDYLLIITATNGFVTRPIATYLGVDDIIATDPELVGSRYTGNYVGTPSFQHGKVLRLQEWLQAKDFDLGEAYFYSDSINDLPLLEQVGHPVAVDPDERLISIAHQREWPIISLR